MDDFYDRLMIGFTNNSYDEGKQALLLYKAVLEFLKLTEDFPEGFDSGLFFLRGLFRILNGH